MRNFAVGAVVAVGLSLLVAPGPAFGDEMVAIGKKSNRCLPGPGADCSKVVHKWRLEAHGNLKGVNFQDAKIPGADFRGAQLRDANFMGANLRFANFDGADFSGAKFGGANLDLMQANRATAVGADFSQSARTRSKKQTFTMETGGCGSGGPDIRNFTSQNADFEGVQISGFSLVYWTVTGSNFANSNFVETLVSGGDWAHTAWSGADLSCATFRWGANLRGADFSGATFASTDFSDAFLCDTKMPDGTIRDDSC